MKRNKAQEHVAIRVFVSFSRTQARMAARQQVRQAGLRRQFLRDMG
jgi:hypothetical protein